MISYINCSFFSLAQLCAFAVSSLLGPVFLFSAGIHLSLQSFRGMAPPLRLSSTIQTNVKRRHCISITINQVPRGLLILLIIIGSLLYFPPSFPGFFFARCRTESAQSTSLLLIMRVVQIMNLLRGGISEKQYTHPDGVVLWLFANAYATFKSIRNLSICS